MVNIARAGLTILNLDGQLSWKLAPAVGKWANHGCPHPYNSGNLPTGLNFMIPKGELTILAVRADSVEIKTVPEDSEPSVSGHLLSHVMKR